MTILNRLPAPWCIVVADDHGHEWAPPNRSDEGATPVQYARLGGSSTLLQRALGRATRLSPASQVMVTVLEEYREFWEPSTWFVRPDHRFICESRAESTLTAATAVLKIAGNSPSNVVVILPGCVQVRRECVLESALGDAIAALSLVPEGVLTLAMIDPEHGVDEDYLVLDRSACCIGQQVLGVARRPNTWVAHLLRQQGALIASGIVIGYAGALAAHVSRQWPGLTRQLNDAATTATAASAECELSTRISCRGLRPALASLRWHAPTLKQRALTVAGCGWNGLRSARAVARAHDYAAAVAKIRVPTQSPATMKHPILS